MLLKQLKQFTLSATRRSAVLKTDVKWLARFYGSPAVCKSLTTSKVPKRLSREDRRAAVESFVNEYRATNAGKFPTLQVIHKEVGGGYYIVRGIFQELKLKPKAPLPIVANALSEVSVSIPNDVLSQTLDETQSHSSACDAEQFSPGLIDREFQVSASVPNDVPSQTLDETQSHNPACEAEQFSPVVVDHEFQVSVSVPNDVPSQTLDETQSHSSACDAEQFSPGLIDHEFQVSDSVPNEILSQTLDDTQSHSSACNAEQFSPGVVEFQVSASVPNDVPSQTFHETQSHSSTCDGEQFSPGVVDHEIQEHLTHTGSQESKADPLEDAAASANIVPTKTRQVLERGVGEVKTGERSSAWSNIMSFAKEFANYWRKR